MLKSLLELKEVSINISTKANGEKNIVVLVKGLDSLVLTGSIDESRLMEEEIKKFANSDVKIKVNSNNNDINQKTQKVGSVGSTKKNQEKVTEKDIDSEINSLLSEFGL